MADLIVTETALGWDPYSGKYFDNPYPAFKKLREEAPIYYNEEHGFYAVSRYDDVQEVLGNRDTFISGRGEVLEHIKSNAPIPEGMFIAEDPPLHTVHRGVLTRVFTPKRMSALEPQIRELCARSLDPLVEGGAFDFIEDLGADMPMRVIGMLLGIPEQDLKKVQQHVDDTTYAEFGKPRDMTNADFVGHHFDDYVEWRIKNPSDDLMTELLNTEFVDEQGVTRKLSRTEILVFLNLLAGAGNETTNRLIGWTGKTLAEHPDQRRQIYENRALIPQAIEEILRFEPPGPAVARYVSKDVEFHGVKVPAGSAILALVAAANRDEAKFENGERFDIHRPRVAHMTFGFGFHNCLGNALARVEGRVALDEIIKRFPEWEIDRENAVLFPSSTVRGWDALPAYRPGATSKAKKREAAAEIQGAERWTLTMKTPAGPQELALQLLRDGASLTGRCDSAMGSLPISSGKIEGEHLSWALHVTKPMPVKISFNVALEGDVMKGVAKLGMFGDAAVEAKRTK